MSDWAIVIGINKYWSEAADLKLALNDALAVTQWLVDPNGGKVPADHIFLLTKDAASNSPSTFPDGTTPIPALIRWSEATFDNLQTAITELSRISGAKGDRFFFYFAGHGLVLGRAETKTQGLLMADFNGNFPNNAMTFESIKGFFATTRFQEQFFIIDACRSSIRSDDFNGVTITFGTYPKRYEDPIPAPVQYELYATAPFAQSTEPLNTDEQNSAFTEVLLEGLKGVKGAKTYQSKTKSYRVTVSTLFEYVVNEVKARRIRILLEGKPAIQSPTYNTTNNGAKMSVLSEIETGSVADVALNIRVTPPSVWDSAAVLLRSADSSYDKEMFPVTESPLILTPRVLPMPYLIKAFVPGFTPVFTPEGSDELSDRYDMEDISIDFKPDPPIDFTPDPGIDFTPGPAIDFTPGPTTDFTSGPINYGSPPWRTVRDDLPPGTLTISSIDPLAPMDIVDSDNNLVAFGSGQLNLDNLEKGFYRARLSLPDENSTGKLIELTENDQNISLDGALPVDSDFFNSVVDGSNLTLSTNSKIIMLPTSGAIAAGGSSTVLMLVSLSLDGTKWNNGLGPFSPPAFPNDSEEFVSEKICVIIADETVPSEQIGKHLSSLDLRLRDQNGDGDPVILEGGQWSQGIGRFTGAAKDGNYILSISQAGRTRANFSVSLLPGRTSLLILHRLTDGELRIYGFSPAVESSGAETPDPSFLQLRRMELLQRLYINNRIDITHALTYADEIQKAEVFDPLAAGLSGFTKVSLDRAGELADLPQRLMWDFKELSDGYVLYAEQLAARGEPVETIRENYLEALNRGIPVFARGARRLAGAAEKYEFTHPRLTYLRHVVDNLPQNSVWTYWLDDPGGEGS